MFEEEDSVGGGGGRRGHGTDSQRYPVFLGKYLAKATFYIVAGEIHESLAFSGSGPFIQKVCPSTLGNGSRNVHIFIGMEV